MPCHVARLDVLGFRTVPRDQWQPFMVGIGHSLVSKRLVPPVPFGNGIAAFLRRHAIAKIRLKVSEHFGERPQCVDIHPGFNRRSAQ